MSTAPDESVEKRVFKVTHPFHRLFECCFEIVTIKHLWSEEKAYFYNSSGELESIPIKWTDLYDPPLAVQVSCGKSAFTVADLLDLHQFLLDITSNLSNKGSDDV